MGKLTPNLSVTALFLLTVAVQVSATTSCFSFVDGLGPGEAGVCADSFYQLGSEVVFGADHGPTSAEHDATTLFPGGLPAHLLPPFRAGSVLSIVGLPDAADSFSIKMTSEISLVPTTELITFVEADVGSRNLTVFTPTNSGGGTLTLDIAWSEIFVLTDPPGNASGGTVLFSSNFILSDPGGFIAIGSGGADLDTAFSTVPTFFGAFDGADVTDLGFGSFRIAVSLLNTFDVESGEQLKLETGSFASIFSDGFESGDTSAWSAASVDSTVFTISSPDPTVSFSVVVPLPAALFLFGSAFGVLGLLRRKVA